MRRAFAMLAALVAFGPRPAAARGGPKPPADCRPRAGGSHLAGREISAEAADRQRLAPGTVRLGRAGEHRLRDGRVLLQPAANEPGTLFTGEEWARRAALATEEMRARRVAEGEPFHPLRGLIDDAPRFNGEALSLAAAFAARLAREGLGADDAGVDALAARWRDAGCRVENPVFAELTAWLGRAAIDRLRARGLGAAPSTRAVERFAEPVIEWDAPPAVKRWMAPWEIAARLLADAGAHAGALLDEAVGTAATVRPVAPIANDSAAAAASTTTTTSPGATRAPAGANGQDDAATPAP